MINRRTLLKSTLLLSSTKLWANAIPLGMQQKNLYASAYTNMEGVNYVALFDESGEIHWTAELPERAHAPLFHPKEAIVGIVARRPGFYIDLYNIDSPKRLTRIEPTTDHHFYGHAIFSQDGEMLITAENHYPTGQGKIFLRNWRTNEILQEFSSYGVGPHELHLLDEETLVIANGGQRTHPDNDRKVLNLDTMHPNVAFVSLKTGELIKSFDLPEKWRQLSMRHVDINASGQVVVAFQYQGFTGDDVPLVATMSLKDNELQLVEMPLDIQRRFNQYCGSVTFDQSGDLLAISSPRGGIVAYWHIPSNRYFEHSNYRDVCGVSQTSVAHQFLLTTGEGKRIIFNPITGDRVKMPTMKENHWDNHVHHLAV